MSSNSNDIPAAADRNSLRRSQEPISDPAALFSSYAKKLITSKRIILDPSVVQSIDILISTVTKHRNQSQHQEAANIVFNIFEILGIDWTSFDEFKLRFRPLITTDTSLTVDEHRISKESIEKIICNCLYELSIVSFYLKIPNCKEYSLWLTQIVGMNPNVEIGHAKSAMHNYLFCLSMLNGIKQQLSVDPDRYPLAKRYNCLNPSIIKCDIGYLINLRTVNYYMKENIYYFSKDDDNIIRTQNYLMGLDENLKVLWDIEVMDCAPTTREPSRVHGLEDCRIFWLPEDKTEKYSKTDIKITNGDIIENRIQSRVTEIEGTRMTQGAFSAVEVIENDVVNPVNHHSSNYLGFDLSRLGVSTTTWIRSQFPQVAVGRFNPVINEDGKVEIKELIPMTYEKALHRCEKNWVFFTDDENKSHFIYDHWPLTMIEARPVNEWMAGKSVRPMHTICRMSMHKEQPLRMMSHRGSSLPIRYILWKGAKNEVDIHLICVHSVIFNNKRRYYYNKLLAYDLNWNLVAISKPFNIMHKGIEYCAGMVLDHSGKNLIFTLGVEDREAYIVSVKREEIDELMFPITHLLLDIQI
jgi:hypothetical protein